MDNTNHTTAKLAVKGETALAIVLAGIASADALYTKYEDLFCDEKQKGNLFPANYFERASTEQNDEYYALRKVMPYLPATSLVEAAAQVGEAMNVIAMAHDELPDLDEVNRAFKRMEGEVARLLHSAMRAMEALGQFSLTDMGLSCIRGANLDPWANIEDVVEKLLSEGVK